MKELLEIQKRIFEHDVMILSIKMDMSLTVIRKELESLEEFRNELRKSAKNYNHE